MDKHSIRKSIINVGKNVSLLAFARRELNVENDVTYKSIRDQEIKSDMQPILPAFTLARHIREKETPSLLLAQATRSPEFLQ